VRITLDHQPLRFRPSGVAAELPPCDKKLLLGREAVDHPRGFRLLEGTESNAGSGQIADRLTQDELAVVVDARLDEVALELIDDALAKRVSNEKMASAEAPSPRS